MARMTFRVGDEWALKLSKLATSQEEVARRAIYAGAKVVADKIKGNLETLPEDQFRYLPSGEQFAGLPKQQKKDLVESFGVTPITTDEKGNYNAKIGFDGYGSTPTRAYPKGVPNQLIARAVESGSSVRKKTPFVRPAVNATKKVAQAEMGRVVDEEIKKIMK